MVGIASVFSSFRLAADWYLLTVELDLLVLWVLVAGSEAGLAVAVGG